MDQIRDWSIYKITSPSGRIYVGKTCNIASRLSSYRRLDCKSQKLIHRSLLKYGYISHKVEIIDSFSSDISFANGKEIFWIRTNMSNKTVFAEMNGMNMCAGGRGTIGRKASEETKAKMREVGRALRHTEETKKRISEAGKGNKYNLGRKQTQEWIEKRSNRMKGNKFNLGRKQTPERVEQRVSQLRGVKFSDEVKRKFIEAQTISCGVPILQFDKAGAFIREFRSVSEAARILNAHQGNISKVLLGERKSTKSFIFKYKSSVI